MSRDPGSPIAIILLLLQYSTKTHLVLTTGWCYQYSGARTVLVPRTMLLELELKLNVENLLSTPPTPPPPPPSPPPPPLL
ncbi:uncharacterized protein RAG0_08604 [Rhynchosporium agropyri]|uniref:Secreted protein n=1 Tax=Rhynchosporium agropyri TaxID=914238 RepID=A0A1E1KRI3_9HELO|nr:uncharacterized protein RAG0_08604 [Rhynchosporium agropyri]